MKKIALIALMVASAAGVFAQDVKVSAGATVGLGLANFHMEDSSNKSDFNYNNLNISVFGDFTFGEVFFGYTTSVGQYTSKSGSVETKSDLAHSYLTAGAYGKYPFSFGAFAIEPKVGIEYYHALSIAYGSSYTASDESKKDYNDIFLGLGANLKYELTPSIYLVAPMTYDICLTPNPAAATNGVTYSNSLINFALGVGFKF